MKLNKKSRKASIGKRLRRVALNRQDSQQEEVRPAGKPGPAITQLEKLRSSISKQQKSSAKVPKEKLYRRLAKAYRYAGALAESGPDWTHFCKHEYWESSNPAPSVDSQQDALRYVLGFVFATTGNPSLQKKVSKYRAALEPFFERRVSPEKLLDRLLEKGLTGLGNRAATGRYGIICRLTEEQFEGLEKGSTVTLKIKRVGRTSAEASIVP